MKVLFKMKVHQKATLLIVTVFIRLFAVGQVGDSLRITGQIPGFSNNQSAYLSVLEYSPLASVPPKFTRVDVSPISDNGRFYLHDVVKEGPRFYSIQFSEGANFICLPFNNENVHIGLPIDVNRLTDSLKHYDNLWEYVKIDGSSTANDYKYYVANIRSLYYNVSSLNSVLKDTLKDFKYSGREKMLAANAAINAYNRAQRILLGVLGLCPNRDNIPGIFIEANPRIQRDSGIVHLYNLLNDEEKNSYHGKLFANLVKLCIGQPAPDFKMNAIDGNQLSLRQTATKNKLTILHFWSSHSVQRKEVNQELAEVYDLYKKKGLIILNVSLDANASKWKKAIEEDKLPGFHASDFQEEAGEPAMLYRMMPSDSVNILIGTDGKILAWDIQGIELKAYLFKYFGE